MIFDRTESDKDIAVQLINKIKNDEVLTNEEFAQLERGTLTINTLNRIENKQAELKSIFNQLGYWNTDIINRTWSYVDYFKQDDFDRISSNTEILRNAFFVYKDTPEITDNNFTKYETINTIERILHDLEQISIFVKNNFRQCGTFSCGEV